MTDKEEFSLKGKEIVTRTASGKVISQAYSKDDIESLRQNVIENLKRMVNKAHVMGWSVEEVHKGIERVINKNFGMDDKEEMIE